ncbi:hypothetical protein [Halarcobacter sp.]|uniref:hypothetical protein n=1 Tax=Halarcobacter sp. TaxID=2321133 RepID=UPI002AAB394A|nr:hypothetical protein [Halarcobacter sp.]
MGLFGFGGAGFQAEERSIQDAMNRIGAYKGSHSENCERCNHWLNSSQTGSKNGFGGCSRYGTKVFASYVCSNYQRG